MKFKDEEWQPIQMAGNTLFGGGFLFFLSNLSILSCGKAPLDSVLSNALTNDNLSIAFLGVPFRLLFIPALDAVCNVLLKSGTNNKKACKYKKLLIEEKQAHYCSKITCLQETKNNRFVKKATDKPDTKYQCKNDKFFF